ncbi:hypothetical protein EDD37DRAFT_259870 [Exophiala viscosa]|uniref:C2H2-type domain-containing protein n=1 Tax=Exophiala viscosa TaxID=2486360 RepID=A0AAN6IHX3_9EURO|nr:hypothetical protein EDD36DRAFT_25662 [Exophiala viscosa]KAI1627374.1 hypothetical protein EDD37DRAFT_259870 [Exophiala viscosa]
MTSAAAPFTFVHETSHRVVDGTATKAASAPRRHICGVCNRHFKRSEHLLRHVRAHRQEKPFNCRYCPKGFARKDLLSRHEKTLHSLEYEGPVHNSHRGPRENTGRRDSLSFTVPTKTPPRGREDGVTNLANADTIVIRADKNLDLAQDFFEENQSLNDDVALVEAPLDLLNAHMGILPVTSRLNTHSSSMEQTSLLGGAGPFPPFAGSILSSNGNGAEAEQGLQVSLQNNGPGQNMIVDRPEPVSSFAMPLELATPDFFAMIDDSLFTQMSLPTETIDFECSPELFGAGSTSNTNREGVVGSAGNVQQTSSNSGFAGNHPKAATDGSILNPESSKRRNSKSERPTIDNLVKKTLLDDLRSNYHVDEQQLAQLPSSRMLDNFLWKFFQCFHKHVPIFHVPTFDPATTPAPLLLALCSIGALYTLNRKHAAALHLMANDALEATLPRKYTGQPPCLEPIWQTQCRALITFGAMFGGSLGDTGDGISELGSFVRPYALHRARLSSHTRARHLSSWEDWIEFETCKRLLCYIYISSSLNSATFGLPPGFSGFRDLNFEIPAEEALWDAPTREKWQQIIDTHVAEEPATLSAVLSELVLGDEMTFSNRTYSRLGRFATTVLMHGVNVHMYYLAQSRSSLIMNNVDANIGYAVRLSHHTQTERALTRCQEFLKTWQLAHDDSQHSRQEDSLIFNCQALLRLSYVRVFSGMRYFNRTTLLYEDPALIASAVGTYLGESRERTAFLTKAAEQVMFCFTTPIRAGHMLTRKTAAFTWSIEHAVACWDCNLFLGKWIHNVEIQEADTPLNQEEIAIFDSLKEALQDAENPYDPQMSLAAQVTRTWADFMDDVWVWQITLRMGNVLRQLAKVYESSWQEQQALTYGLQSVPEPELQ